MADSRIFSKTPAGSAEVTTRASGLSLAWRRVLILIDGVRDVDTLAAMVPAGGLPEALAGLERAGLIAVVGDSAIGVDIASSESRPAPIPEAELTTVDEAKRRAVRALHDLLGPAADSIAIAIERSATGDELRAYIRDAERMVTSAHGPATAAAFIAGIRRR